MNRMAFKNYQSMNMVHRTKDGNELWLGDYYAATNTSLLIQHNIRSVLTSAAMLGVSYPKDLNITHKIINAFDIPSYRMTPHYEEAFRFIDEGLKKGNILVHCAAGISRSTTFVLVYLMRSEDMTFKNAMDYVRSKRSIICPNYGFQNQLKRYELTLKKTAKKQEKEDTFANSNYSAFSQKKAVFNFLNEDKQRSNKGDDKFLSTVGGRRSMVQEKQSVNLKGKGVDYSGYVRGKSMNYSNKLSNTFSSGSDNEGVKKLTKQFLTFKLQTPKIVTIKK